MEDLILLINYLIIDENLINASKKLVFLKMF